jgi:hypothetical protein
LRIHRGPANNTNETDSKSLPLGTDDAIRSFWGKFESTTGWQMAPRSRRIGGTPSLMPAVGNSVNNPIVLDPFSNGDISEEAFEESFVDSLSQVSAVGKAAATELATAATDLISELTEATQAIRTQHAELAARANVVIGAENQSALADRIAEILADASESCGCQAAVLYTLDDDTSELQIRSAHGLPESRLTAGPRPLQGARGDLEAMVKNVVTIDDLNAGPLDTWNAPEPAAAAICAVVSAADIPMGTLWFFAEETKQFGPADVALARLAARSVATELATAVADPFGTPASLAVDRITSDSSNDVTIGSTPPKQVDKTNRVGKAEQAKNDIRDVAQWQFQGLPIGTEIAEDWKADGMIESPNDFAIGWHTWDVLPDGSIQMAIAEAVQADITGAMSATVARAAMTAHSGYRHTPSQMLSRIGDTLWQTSLGEQLMSMMYVRVDPETGEGEIASAGLITAMIASRMGYRPVVTGKSDPLCSHIDSQSVLETFRLMKGETLLAYSPGFLTGGVNHTAIGGMLHDAMKSGDNNPLAAIRRSLAKMPLTCERGASTLVRI